MSLLLNGMTSVPISIGGLPCGLGTGVAEPMVLIFQSVCLAWGHLLFTAFLSLDMVTLL
jgi:hypothetical protein